jgi:uncharacterized protein
MSRFFLDVNIAMYAGGTAHPLREPSQRIVMAVATGQIDAVTDAEVFQELLHRYLYIHQREKGFRIFDTFHGVMHGRVLPIEESDVQRARELAERYSNLSPRDLIHLAVMLNNAITEIVTADTAFEVVAGIHRIDPTHFAGVTL